MPYICGGRKSRLDDERMAAAMKLEDLATTETTGSNTQSEEAPANLDEMLANPAQFCTQLEELLNELACHAEEDRWHSEAEIEEIDSALWQVAHEQTTPSNTPSEDGSTKGNDDMDEMKRPSEAGWTSYNDDPFTSARDMAHKHSQDIAAEDYPFTTQAGTGWWGETSQSGFGPTALLPLGTAGKNTPFEGVTITVDAEDETLVRREAGFRWDESSPYKVRIRGQYRDYLAAAGVFAVATDDDDEPTYGDDDMFIDGVLNDSAWEQQLVAENTTVQEQAAWERQLAAEGLGVIA